MPHIYSGFSCAGKSDSGYASSIRSLPTSAGQEDHNANSMTAARHAYEIIENLRQILAIEVYTANRAIE